MSQATEVELAKRLMAGDTSAFEPFCEGMQGRLFRFAFANCGQREDAEEVAQETLLKVFESLKQLREPERIRPWVFRIAKNICYMRRRKSIYAPEEELSLDQLMPGFRDHAEGRKLEIADWSHLPENEAMSAETHEMLRQSILELPEIYRHTLLLRDMEELSTEETAEVLGINTDAVKTRLHRARLALRQKMDRRMRMETAAR